MSSRLATTTATANASASGFRNGHPLGWALGLLLPLTAPAEVSLQVGVLSLQPDLAHQTLMLYATNSGIAPVAVGGFDLAIEIAPGVVDAPRLGGVDLVTGSLFESYAPTQSGDPANTARHQAWYLTVPALGLFPEIPGRTAVPLATLVFDTTDFGPGEFTVAVTDTYLGDTMLYDAFGLRLVGFTAHDGRLRLGTPDPPPPDVPDSLPGFFAVLVVGLSALAFHRIARPLARPHEI